MNLITESDYNSVSTADRKKIRREILHPLSSSTYRVVRLFSKVHRRSCKVHFIFQTKPHDFFCINRSPCHHFVPLRRFKSDKLVQKISFPVIRTKFRSTFLQNNYATHFCAFILPILKAYSMRKYIKRP